MLARDIVHHYTILCTSRLMATLFEPPDNEHAGAEMSEEKGDSFDDCEFLNRPTAGRRSRI